MYILCYDLPGDWCLTVAVYPVSSFNSLIPQVPGDSDSSIKPEIWNAFSAYISIYLHIKMTTNHFHQMPW